MMCEGMETGVEIMFLVLVISYLGAFKINQAETFYRNCQTISTQESPRKVSAGMLPLSKDTFLMGDLCDVCKPGDEIKTKHEFPISATLINHIMYVLLVTKKHS